MIKEKRVLIYDVAAERTGAITILTQYYKRYTEDNSCKTYIVTSVIDFPKKNNVEVLKYPWTKKTRFHRLYSDLFFVHTLVKKYDIDEVINLQNIAIRGIKAFQVLYLHNAIPITDLDFDFRREKELWIYKHITSRVIVTNLKYADRIIVQANWIKKELCQRYGISSEIVDVEKIKVPVLSVEDRIVTETPVFFYPATFFSYKNHMCIIKACELLKKMGKNNYEVVFTIDACDEGHNMQQLINKKELPIRLVGLLGKDEMECYYKKSTLLFASYMETVGLPLVEAQGFNADIISVDLPYAREAVGTYRNVKWFRNNDSSELANIMKNMI